MGNEELSRKIAEKLGWSLDDATENYHHHPECKERRRSIGHMDTRCGGSPGCFPDFLSPAVFWPKFDKWAVEREAFVSSSFFGGRKNHRYEFTIELGSDDSEIFVECGDSRTEAGCRAWIAALEGAKAK